MLNVEEVRYMALGSVLLLYDMSCLMLFFYVQPGFRANFWIKGGDIREQNSVCPRKLDY